jgi:hypothetical protein
MDLVMSAACAKDTARFVGTQREAPTTHLQLVSRLKHSCMSFGAMLNTQVLFPLCLPAYVRVLIEVKL